MTTVTVRVDHKLEGREVVIALTRALGAGFDYNPTSKTSVLIVLREYLAEYGFPEWVFDVGTLEEECGPLHLDQALTAAERLGFDRNAVLGGWKNGSTTS